MISMLCYSKMLHTKKKKGKNNNNPKYCGGVCSDYTYNLYMYMYIWNMLMYLSLISNFIRLLLLLHTNFFFIT